MPPPLPWLPCAFLWPQIQPHDAFGQQMLINLESRGCALLGIEGAQAVLVWRAWGWALAWSAAVVAGGSGGRASCWLPGARMLLHAPGCCCCRAGSRRTGRGVPAPLLWAPRSHADAGGAPAALHRLWLAPGGGPHNGSRVQVRAGGAGGAKAAGVWCMGAGMRGEAAPAASAPAGPTHPPLATVEVPFSRCLEALPPSARTSPAWRPLAPCCPPPSHCRPAPSCSRCIDPQDKRRIERLEIFDEFEEWHLIQARL